MTKPTFSLLLLLAATPAAFAQQPGAPAKAPIVLKSGHMQVQAHGAANRPDKAPSFPGGAPALGVFFQQHAKYPEAARVKNITGNVLLTATVGVDGTLSDFKVALPRLRRGSPASRRPAPRLAARHPQRRARPGNDSAAGAVCEWGCAAR